MKGIGESFAKTAGGQGFLPLKWENGSVSWLEPARAFVKSLNQAAELVQNEDKAGMATFLKQIGSNHILFDKCISFSAKKPFEMLAERRQSRREATSFHLKNPDWRCVPIKNLSAWIFTSRRKNFSPPKRGRGGRGVWGEFRRARALEPRRLLC